MKMLVFMILCSILANGAGAGLLLWEIRRLPERYGLGENRRRKTGAWIYGVSMSVIAVGISVFIFLFYQDNSFLFTLKRVTMLALLWPVAYVDFVTCRIPNRFIAGGLLARGSILTAELILEQENLLPVLLSDAAAGLAFFLTAALCALIVKNSIGAGDMKLFFVMGTFLGLQGTWGAVFLSLVVSFVIAVVLLVTKKKSRKAAIPFGPALMIGTYCSVFLTGM